MRRKLTLPVWPPVAMTMPFLASMAMSRPSACDHDAVHPSAFARVAHDLRHLVLEQDLRALLARAFGETAHQPRAVAVAPRRDHLARDMPFVGDEHPRHGRGVRRDDRLLDEGDAVVEQELEGRHAFVGERAHQIAVVVAAVAAPVADPVGENLVGAVLDVEFLLQGVAAAEMDAAAAQHGVAADVEILLDDDDRGAVVARRHGGGEARGAGADDHDVSRKIPFHPGIAWRERCGRHLDAAGHRGQDVSAH